MCIPPSLQAMVGRRILAIYAQYCMDQYAIVMVRCRWAVPTGAWWEAAPARRLFVRRCSEVGAGRFWLLFARLRNVQPFEGRRWF